MSAIVGTLTGKVLIQIADGEPVEVGTVDIPIHVSTTINKATRDAQAVTGQSTPGPTQPADINISALRCAVGLDSSTSEV